MILLSFRRYGISALLAATLAHSAVAAPAKPKPKPKPPVKKSQVGIKKTPQMTGSTGRFGEIYGLKSGFTYEILSARYSYDAFDDYNSLYPDPEQKLLVLKIAVKNNTPSDLWFNSDQHSFQVQDSNNQTFNGNSYRLSTKGSQEVSLTLKPGQGAGLEPGNAFEVAIAIPDSSKISKIILQNGRKGTKDDVMRFFVAGAQGGDAKNVIAPLPVQERNIRNVFQVPLKTELKTLQMCSTRGKLWTFDASGWK